MAKKAATVTASNSDQAVLDLLKKVQTKKEEIRKAKTRPQWKTNCVFNISGHSGNIQVIRNVNELVGLHALLTSQEAAMKQSAVDLEVDFDGIWQGFSFDDWKEDIKTRVEQLQISKKEKELEELDARVNRLVTTEQRREMELKALQDILK